MENLVPAEEQFSSSDLFEAFKAQLSKDFEQSNFPSDFIHNLPPDYTRIHAQLVSELHRAESKAGTPIMTLLYRIDLSEVQLKKYLREHPLENQASSLATLIIKRVLQKVVIRQLYKKGDAASAE